MVASYESSLKKENTLLWGRDDETFYQCAERLWMNLRGEGMIVVAGFHGDTKGFSEIEMAPLHVKRKGDALYRNFLECDAKSEPYYIIYTVVQGTFVAIEVHRERLSVDSEPAEHIVDNFLRTHGA